MRKLAFLPVILLVPALFAGTEPKPKKSDYTAHKDAGELSLAGDYMVRTFGVSPNVFFIKDHLVVEAALYGPLKHTMRISSGQFSLRIYTKKTETLYAQNPGIVSASLKYEDWDMPRGLQVGAGVGDTGVLIGAPRHDRRFPDDPTAQRLPAPPTAPEQANRSGIETERPTAAQTAVNTALPEGEHALPVSGFLFFPYKGKPAAIESVDLIYDGPDGQIVLKLK